MNKLTLIAIFSLFCFLNVCGANFGHNIQGRVADKMNGVAIPAKIYLMNTDSTVIDTTTATVEEAQFSFQDKQAWYVFNDKIKEIGRYIIKAVMPGYKDAYIDVELKSSRQSYISAKPILMVHDYIELSDVVVKATKIKMMMSGDTIVYNADAFNLAEGSMLDALVSRLPGAQLTKDGQIYVNGKLIESLLINGRDFFTGNPKMALENLPSYTVNKIKVYKRLGTMSRLMQSNMGDQSLVMDVKLKKEYDTTIFGNAESGAGTNGRFALKGFGMKNSQKEMLLAFANVNNLNDNQIANIQGQWTPQEDINGLQTNRTANVSYAKFFGGDMFKWISTSNTVSHNGEDIQMLKNAEVYLPSRNIYQHAQDGTINKSTIFDSKNAFKYEENGKYSTHSTLDILYKHNNKYKSAFTSNSEGNSLLNELNDKTTHTNEQFKIKIANENNFNISVVDLLRTGFSVQYNKQNADRFSLYDLRYMNTVNARDFRNNYLKLNNNNLDVRGNISYDWNWPGWSLQPGYDYNFKYNKTNNELYRLDKLVGFDSLHYDILPSAKNALLAVIDNNNSYWYTEYQNHHRIFLEWYLNAASGANKLNIEFGYIRMPLRVVNKNMFYVRAGRKDVKRNTIFFEPEAYFRWGQTYNWELNASIKSEIPNLVNMIDYRDDSDPLFLISGNPNLRNIHRYNASLSLKHEGKGQRMWHASINYNKTDNDIAFATLYNTVTGTATMQPVSVNGNWRTNVQIDYSLPLDSARKWTLDNHLTIDYDHNVDMTTTDISAGIIRSIVNNWQYGANVKLNFRPNEKYEFTLYANSTYYYINSSRSGFENIHAGDYRLGFETELQLPWKLSFGSNFGMYGRRGYYSAMMNTTEWIWNAHLARSFINGSLLAKITGFDLLHQKSTTKYEMNKQGRTEIRYNSLSSYLMCSIVWKFNVSPRSKK